MSCVHYRDRPFFREVIKQSRYSWEKKPRRYTGWLCTKQVRDPDDYHGWPADYHYETVFEAFKLYYPELVQWFVGRENCTLGWRKAMSINGETMIQIRVDGTLAGLRRFEEAWKPYVETNMSFFAWSMEFEGMSVRRDALIDGYTSSPRLTDEEIDAFFPFEVSVPTSAMVRRAILDHRKWRRENPLAGPVLLDDAFSGTNRQISCRLANASDAMLLKLMSGRETQAA